MPTGGCDLQCAASQRLPVHVREVSIVPRWMRRRRSIAVRVDSRAKRRRIVQGRNRLIEGADGVQLQPFNDRSFRAIRTRQEQAIEALPARGGSNRKNPSGGVNAAVERQLAEQQHIVDMTSRQDTARRQYPEGNRQVERGACLADVGRRQVDRDAVFREFKPGISNRAADAIATFTDGGIRKADHREARKSERNVHFHIHGRGFDAEHRRRPHARKHRIDRDASGTTTGFIGDFE
jgi:hypothetical protein